ncbi:MAG: hypothetical protein WCJ97_09540 [Phycisphaerae bacterium]
MRRNMLTILSLTLVLVLCCLASPNPSPSTQPTVATTAPAEKERIVYEKVLEHDQRLVVVREPTLPCPAMADSMRHHRDHPNESLLGYFGVRVELRIPNKPPLTVGLLTISDELAPPASGYRETPDGGRGFVATGFEVADIFVERGSIYLAALNSGYIQIYKWHHVGAPPVGVELSDWNSSSVIRTIDTTVVNVKLSRQADDKIHAQVDDLRPVKYRNSGVFLRTDHVLTDKGWSRVKKEEVSVPKQ